jgi:hypothetical protein
VGSIENGITPGAEAGGLVPHAPNIRRAATTSSGIARAGFEPFINPSREHSSHAHSTLFSPNPGKYGLFFDKSDHSEVAYAIGVPVHDVGVATVSLKRPTDQ